MLSIGRAGGAGPGADTWLRGPLLTADWGSFASHKQAFQAVQIQMGQARQSVLQQSKFMGVAGAAGKMKVRRGRNSFRVVMSWGVYPG